LHQGLSVGQFTAVIVYINQLFAPLNFLGTIYGAILGSYVDLENFSSMLAEVPDIQDRPGARALPVPPEGLSIEFRDVSFTYPSRQGTKALSHLSFTVPAGTITALVGETGSGKSTISRLLFRFYEAAEGAVLVGGKNVLDVTQTSLRKQLGIVPQDCVLYNDTLEYNVHYGDLTRPVEAVHRAAKGARLEDFVAELPKGWETQVGERGQQISGGQKQRVGIARVLVKDPPIVVLDEATSALDSRTEAAVQMQLESLTGRTMLVIAHRLSTIQNADQIIVMAHGAILEKGTHAELLAKGNHHESCYTALWEKQKQHQDWAQPEEGASTA